MFCQWKGFVWFFGNQGCYNSIGKDFVLIPKSANKSSNVHMLYNVFFHINLIKHVGRVIVYIQYCFTSMPMISECF